MDYAEVQAAFFQLPPGERERASAIDASPGRQLRDAIEAIATISFWSEPAYLRYAELGLDFLGGYVLSRSYPLGDAAPAVVAAAFGVFEPGLVEGLRSQARAVAAPAAIGAARLAGAQDALAAVLTPPGAADPDSVLGQVVEVVEVLRRGCAAASPLGRPLFAGLAALEWPKEPLGQLWHACSALRELRGDGHLAACAAEGLDGVEANILTELRVGWPLLEYTATRGWSAEAMQAGVTRLEQAGLVADGGLTPEGRRVREQIEAATERSVAAALEAIGSDLDVVVRRGLAWSDEIIKRGWFPPDPYKRAAG